jgi:TetR/AcrR family transcriptional regulator, regulator of mycofactocin system
MSSQNWLEQSPPALHGLPVGAAAQKPLTQLLLQQSLFVMQGGFEAPMLTQPQVFPLQNWLVQSPPSPHVPPTLFFWQVPPEQLLLVQSLLLAQEPPAETGWHVKLLSQNLLQQSPPPVQLCRAPAGMHATVVLVDVLVDVELDVVVVALTHTVEEASDDATGHPGPHATPALQQVRLAPLPHGVVPAGQPQRLWETDWHATPALQHLLPQGVVPLGQQHELAGSVHVPPLTQQPWPQTGEPAGQVTAPPRNGRKKAAAAAAAPVAPRTFSAPRLLVGWAIARDRSSKDRFTWPSRASPPKRCISTPLVRPRKPGSGRAGRQNGHLALLPTGSSATMALVGTAGLRERRAARTRDAIVSAALALFEERGFQGTTVDEIAARADVAPRTFFRYFPTKEAVLFARAADDRAKIAAGLEARPRTEHPFLSLTTVVGTFTEDSEEQDSDIRLLQKISTERPEVWAYQRTLLETEMVQMLAGFVAGRLGVDIDRDPRPRVWAAVVMTTYRIAFHMWLDGGRRGRLGPVLDGALAATIEASAVLSTERGSQ